MCYECDLILIQTVNIDGNKEANGSKTIMILNYETFTVLVGKVSRQLLCQNIPRTVFL